MKLLISVLAALILDGSVAKASSPTYILLNYDYGNQIIRTQMTVLSNGLVMLSTITHGRATRLPDEQLSPGALAKLISDIDNAANAPQVHIDGAITSYGSESGTLVGHTEDGFMTNIVAVIRNKSSAPNQHDTVYYQLKGETLDVISFVDLRVQSKIPEFVSADCKSKLSGL